MQIIRVDKLGARRSATQLPLDTDGVGGWFVQEQPRLADERDHLADRGVGQKHAMRVICSNGKPTSRMTSWSYLGFGAPRVIHSGKLRYRAFFHIFTLSAT